MFGAFHWYYTNKQFSGDTDCPNSEKNKLKIRKEIDKNLKKIKCTEEVMTMKSSRVTQQNPTVIKYNFVVME